MIGIYSPNVLEGFDMSASVKLYESYLHVLFAGRVSAGEMTDVARHSSLLVKDTSVERVLVDARAIEFCATMEDLSGFIHFLGEAYPPDFRHAVLFSPDSPQICSAEFCETLADSKGILLKIFEAPETAMAWLSRN
jgi:hypothetical protein